MSSAPFTPLTGAAGYGSRSPTVHCGTPAVERASDGCGRRGSTGNNVLFGGDGDETFIGGEQRHHQQRRRHDTYHSSAAKGRTRYSTFGTTSNTNTRIVFGGDRAPDLGFFDPDGSSVKISSSRSRVGGSVTVKNYSTSGLNIAIELADGRP
jgi:hypothetical protein